MAAPKGALERVRRGIRTVFFMVTMVVSLVTVSAPVIVAIGDVSVSLGLSSRFACGRCYGLKEHFARYEFRRSLMDIPLVSFARSFVITCVYSLCDGPGLSHGPYLGTVTVCSVASIVILAVKACLFTYIVDVEAGPPSAFEKLHFKKSCGMSILFLSSLVFAFGHIVVAYRTSCRARRKLLFYRIDPESVLCYKNFSGYQKVARSPNPFSAKSSRSDSLIKRKASIHDELELPISLLADVDSKFIACEGLMIHYKISVLESPSSLSLPCSPFHEPNLTGIPPSVSSVWHKLDGFLPHQSKNQFQHARSYSYQFENSPLYAPLLGDTSATSTFVSDEVSVLNLDDGHNTGCIFEPINLSTEAAEKDKFAVVLVHGFGGGVFSWRLVMSVLARQIGCPVVAFDRPGWGLTSRPHRKDWEDKQLPNPYKLESQVDLLISFCLSVGFTSVVFVGHDDGGLLALKTTEKLRAFAEPILNVRGVVLLGVSLSREVIPAFARILLHTTLGKKHMVRPLLRTEITQVINRRAWYNPAMLTTEVLNLYKAPLCVEGWEEALHEIGRLSFASVLSPQNAAALLNSIEDVPVLVVAGAEDALVSLKSTQAMASKLVNSRLVAISGCGHLPHEECPKALLAALQPFIARLIRSPEPQAWQRQ